MNAADILKYGHRTFLSSLDGLDASDAATPGALGHWSIKDIVSHLASYEELLGEVLATFLGGEFGPYAAQMMELGGDGFNARQVGDRADRSLDDVLVEYTDAYERNQAQLSRIPVERRSEVGSIAWYGPEYALDDYLVYTSYGHKREHSGHIDVMRDRLRTGEMAGAVGG